MKCYRLFVTFLLGDVGEGRCSSCTLILYIVQVTLEEYLFMKFCIFLLSFLPSERVLTRTHINNLELLVKFVVLLNDQKTRLHGQWCFFCFIPVCVCRSYILVLNEYNSCREDIVHKGRSLYYLQLQKFFLYLVVFVTNILFFFRFFFELSPLRFFSNLLNVFVVV